MTHFDHYAVKLTMAMEEAFLDDPYGEGAVSNSNILHIFAELHFCPGDDDEPTELNRVGTASGLLLHVGRVIDARKVSVRQTLDQMSSEEFSYYEALFDTRTDYWKESYTDKLPGHPSNLFIVERMNIDNEHRGHGVGLALMNFMLNSALLPNETVVALHPFAMGHESDDVKAEEIGTAKLERYWKRAGFKKLRGSHVYTRFIQ